MIEIKQYIETEIEELNKDFNNEDIEGIELVKIATRRKAFSDILRTINYNKK